MNAKQLIVSLVIIGLCIVQDCPAGAVASRNNTGDDIVIDGDRSDWSSRSAYPNDTANEDGIGEFDVDWARVTMANSSDRATIFIRYELNKGADFNTYPAFYNIFIDADMNRATGYIGGGSQLPIGADYLVQGANVFSFGGGSDQTAFGWTLEASLIADNSLSGRDISLALPAQIIGRPSTFHFVLFGDNSLNGNSPDYYPDGGSRGATGDYFIYSTSPVKADK